MKNEQFLTMLEIFHSFGNEDIIDMIMYLYPDQEKNIEGYKKMLVELGKLTPNPEPQTMRIQVYNVVQEWDYDAAVEDYIAVHGIDPEAVWDECTGQKGEDIGWAIGYSPWEDFLSWKVECTCMDDPRCDSFLKILAHIIWEMTWAGYTQADVKEQIDEIMEVKKRVDDGTEELFELKFNESGGCVFEDLGVEKPTEIIEEKLK